MTTLEALMIKHADELAELEETGDMTDELYQDFFNYYMSLGDIPYGTAKARDGDPYEWIFDRLMKELGLD